MPIDATYVNTLSVVYFETKQALVNKGHKICIHTRGVHLFRHWKPFTFEEDAILGPYQRRTPPVINFQGDHPGNAVIHTRATEALCREYCGEMDRNWRCVYGEWIRQREWE